ncbi:MAG: fibronectin type III domain-containing protein [Chloroflexi bacterium]|nr:fibronectin type III domain-containing protein [Chloroflexota bacterium]OJV91029.1 MAG: hypothetical protein BGO39_05145 [Chloroflexi bacterium 54-19]
MLYKRIGRLQKTGRQTLRKFRLFFIFGGGIAISGALLAYCSWFSFFYLPKFSLLHPQPPAPMQMFMSGKVNLLLNNGAPAANALVTLDSGQQALADSRGQVAFEHLMLHDHWLTVVYNGQHYEQLLHVHTLETTVALPISLETHQLISLLLGAIWLLWTLFLVVAALKYRSIKPMIKLNGWVVAGWARLSLLKWRPTLRLGQVTGLVVSCMVAAILLNPFQDSTTPANAAVLASLPVPTALSVEQDDNNVLLTWNGGVLSPDQTEPPGIGGYRVSWGLAGQALSNTILTTYRMVQIQPLVNGQSYQAKVQSVDMLGNLSNLSKVITFTGDPSRVNALRSRMTGFFDDFNRSAGAFDELKWNQAVSRCNDENISASFINSQFHAHDFITAGRCDRSQIVDRPRATFDFTGRTGTIAFDLDGAERRDFFYLDLMPAALDITGHVDLDVGDVAGYPANMLRFKQNGGNIDIIYTAPNGSVKTVASTDWNPYPPLDWAGLERIPNVRRHWEIKLSKNLTQVYINGKLVLQAALNLPFTRATVHWNHFSYNTNKANEPYSLLHWDNFGFDGPAPTVETHNYRTDGYLGREFMNSSNYSAAATSINIPDSISTATARRFMFTLQTDTNIAYQWSAQDNVKINGQTFAIPKPTDTATTNASFLVGTLNPYSMTIPVPAGAFKTGANSVVFSCLSCGVLNIHAEFDFPKGSAPAFTSPTAIYPATVSPPVIPDVGPAVTIDAFGSTSVTYGGSASSLTGVVPIQFTVHNQLALNGMGIAVGLNKVQLRVDKQVVYEQALNGAPYSHLVYNLDTARFTNGTHQLDIVAYNNNGSISIPDYFLADAHAGDYFPLAITLSNRSVPTPTGLTATAAGANQVNLSWSDNAGTETGYQVERQQSPTGAFTVIARLPANSTGYQDTNLKGGLLYGYRVTGYNTYGQSPYSNLATVVLPVAAPTGLTVTPVSLIQLNLSWTDTTGGIAGFQVERSNGGGYTIVGQVGAGNTTFSDIGLTPNTSYTYRVKSVTPYVTSGYSNTYSGTTPATATYTVSNLADFQAALTGAQPGNTILLNSVAGNTLTLTGPLTVPQGAVIVGSCGADGPVIRLGGLLSGGLPSIANAFTLSGNNIIYGLSLENFANVPIKYTGRGNILRCVSINRT